MGKEMSTYVYQTSTALWWAECFKSRQVNDCPLQAGFLRTVATVWGNGFFVFCSALYYVICLQSDLTYWPTPGMSEELLEDRKSWLAWLASDSAGIGVTDPMALPIKHVEITISFFKEKKPNCIGM